MSRRVVILRANLFVAFVIMAATLSPSWPPTIPLPAFAKPRNQPSHTPPSELRKEVRAELMPNRPDTLRVPDDVVRTLGIRTAAARTPTRSRTLVLSGSLVLDTHHLAHVHTRFAGEVIELGTVEEPSQGTDGERTARRPLRFGDRVEKGQLLAILWSSDLGEKKSEYVDALSRLQLDKETLARLEALFRDEATPERNVRESRRAVEADEIAVVRAERTLRSWRLTDAEIAAVREEAEQVRNHKMPRDPEREKSWARVELRAPLAGTILEVNLAVGDIVDTATDLFKIADLNTLRVGAYVYEEDLPTLLALPQPIRWTVRLKSDPTARPIAGTVEKIGDLIDPNQHTALVMGRVDNSEGCMRAGQFVTAEVELPPTPREVEVPTPALVEDGQESVVFIQPDPKGPVYTMRRVTVTRRAGEAAYVRGDRYDGSRTEAGAPREPFQAGEQVVTSGAVELRAALQGLQEAAKARE